MHRLRKLIAGRPVAVMLHGGSVKQLEARIEEFADLNFCYCSLNLFSVMETRILQRIGKQLGFIFCTFEEDIPRRFDDIRQFLDRDPRKLLITTPQAMQGLGEFVQAHRDQIIFIAKPQPTQRHDELPNSMAGLLLALVRAEATSRIVLFGADGFLGEQKDAIGTYFGKEILAREDRSNALVHDTLLFNRCFPQWLQTVYEKSHVAPLEIINCSPESCYTPLERISYDELRERTGTAPQSAQRETTTTAQRPLHDTESDALMEQYFAGPLATTAAPTILERNYHSHTLIQYRGKFIALAHSLGPVDLMEASEDLLAQFAACHQYFVADTLGKLKADVDSATPRQYTRNGRKYRVLACAGKIYAVPETLWPIDMTQESNRSRADIICTDSIEEMEKLMTAPQPQPPFPPRALQYQQIGEDRPWRRMGVKREEVNPVRSMICDDESFYLHWLARDYYLGLGEIVDTGCLLGGSSCAFGSGLRRNPFVCEKAGRIHSYDLFMYFDGFKSSVLPDCTLRQGDSLLPLFLDNTRECADMIRAYPGDIMKYRWDGKPIELLFVDVAKSWEINNHVIRQFYGNLIPNRSIVIHQDYFHYYCYWIHLTMEYMSEYFRHVHDPGGGTWGYLNTKTVPRELLEIDYSRHFRADQAIALMDRALAPLVGAYKLIVMTAKMRLLADRGLYEQAAQIGREIRQSNDWQDWLLYDVVEAESHLPQALVFPALRERETLCALSRRYDILRDGEQFYAVLHDGQGQMLRASSMDQVQRAIGEPIRPRPAFKPVLYGNHKGHTLVEYADKSYGLPHRLGSVNIDSDSDRCRPGVLQAEALSEVVRMIDSLVPGDAPAPTPGAPRLAQRNYRGFNIVEVQGNYIALAISLGKVDLLTTPPETLRAWHEAGALWVADSLAEARTLIDQSVPTLVAQDYEGFTIVMFRDRYYAVAKPLDANAIVSWSDEELQRRVAAGQCAVGECLEEAQRQVMMLCATAAAGA